MALSAGALQKAGLIKYHRGEMTITDRLGLERAACECYAVGREHFLRLENARDGSHPEATEDGHHAHKKVVPPAGIDPVTRLFQPREAVGAIPPPALTPPAPCCRPYARQQRAREASSSAPRSAHLGRHRPPQPCRWTRLPSPLSCHPRGPRFQPSPTCVSRTLGGFGLRMRGRHPSNSGERLYRRHYGNIVHVEEAADAPGFSQFSQEAVDVGHGY